MSTEENLDKLEALIGEPDRVRGDQGEFEIDLVRQLRAQKLLASMRAANLGPGVRKRLFSSMANKLSPPSVG